MNPAAWRVVLFALLLAAAVLRPAMAQRRPKPAPRVAVLTEIRGGVEVQRAGKAEAKPTQFTTLLCAGDVVRTGTDGSALLMLADGSRQNLAPEASVTIAAGTGKPARLFVELARQVGAVLSSDYVPLDKRGYQLRGYQIRSIGEEETIVLLSPRRDQILENRPTFRWRIPAGASGLRLTLYLAPAEDVVWTVRIENTEGEATRPLPENLPTLAPGEYIWEITGKVDGQVVLDSTRFWVPGPAAARAIRADLRAARELAGSEKGSLAMIGTALHHRLFSEAEAELRSARKRLPGDRTVALLLARVYSETWRPVPADLIADR